MMKQIFILLLLFVFVGSAVGQVRPDQQTSKTPALTDAIYTQEDGTLKKVLFSAFVDWMIDNYAQDTSLTNEIQSLTYSNDTLSLSGGNSVVIAAGVDSSLISTDYQRDTSSAAIRGEITASTVFDSDRNILRVPTVGQNIGGGTLGDFLDYWYFSPPTLSISSLSPSVIEIGTSQAYTISGATTNPGAATLSAGVLEKTYPSTATINSFGAGTSYSQGITFAPLQTPSGDYTEAEYRFQASQDWVKGAESGTATSSTRTIKGVYPIFYGMSATDLSATGNVYTTLTKLVEDEGNKTVTINGSGFIFYAFPASWSDNALSAIFDHNGFNVTGSFTVHDINISSSGLTNDYSTVAYKLYKLTTTTTATNFDYQFNQ